MRLFPALPAVLVVTALAIGGGVAAAATGGVDVHETVVEHSANGDATSVLVHGIGDAAAAATAEGRRFRHSDLQPAGRFVAAGDVVTVSVPTGAPAMDVAIGLIGPYAAHNSGADVGYQQTRLTAGVNRVTAPHDGMVSMVSAADTGEATVTIAGGVAVPTYVRGQSTADSFAADLRRFADAPFVEVVSDRMFGDFQKPKTGTAIAGADLAERTANWDRVIELTNETYGLDERAVGTSHKYPHRIHIASPDSGAGYANASNARIMFQTGTGAAADLFRLPLSGLWGLWHEIGHTYEAPINIFPGTAETITNLSALAVQDGLGFGSRWDESIPLLERYFTTPIADRDWEGAHDRVRLLAWEQLRRAFGDGYLPRFFAALRAEAAKTNVNALTIDDKHAIFVEVASRVADRDLAPFYDQLGFPMSDATRAVIGALPDLREPIWDNVDSRHRIVERLVPDYDPPVGVVTGAVSPVPVGEHVVAAPTVTGLGTASGRGSATAVDAAAVADAVGTDTGRLLVRLRSDTGAEDTIVVRTAAVGGDSIVLRGASNRVVGDLWLDQRNEELRWRAVTSYDAHWSWGSNAYLTVTHFAADGTVLATGTVQGNQTGKVLDETFRDRPYADGEFVLVLHAQPTLLAAYRSDSLISDSSAPQAFRIADGKLHLTAPEAIPGWQSLSGLQGPKTALTRGADVEVEAGLQVHAQISTITGAITLTSPDGTTFAPGQSTLAGMYRKPGEDWRTSANLVLRGGTLADGGTTMRFTLQTGSGFSMPPGSTLRWKPVVRVPADAVAGDSSLELRAEGTTG